MLSRNVILQGRYKIIRQLGQGGMGAVYEAEDIKRFSKEVALKEILIDLARISNPVQQELIRHAFEREAKILTQVDHEAFPQVVDYFTENDAQFLVMELIQGEDLAELLRNRKGPFSTKEIIDWTDQLLDALDYLHTLEPPIIHRDIKPQNLKLTSRGKVKLLDFGIAKGADKQVNTTIATQTFIAATLNYSPFEQILRVLDPTFREALMPLYGERIERVLEQPADPRSDIYALGATLYHLLTNQVPLDALKRALGVWGGKPDALVKPIELNPEIPPAISDWLMKSMEIEWENRFNSAIEMQAAFREAVHSKSRIEEESKNQAWLKEQEELKRERLLIEQERKNMEAERQLHSMQMQEERKRQITLQTLAGRESEKSDSKQENSELPATQVSIGQQSSTPTLLLKIDNENIGPTPPAPTLLLKVDSENIGKQPPAPTLLKLPDNGNGGNDFGNNAGNNENSPVTTLEISAPEKPQNPPTNAMMSELSRYSYLPEEFGKSPEAAPPPVVQKQVEKVALPDKKKSPLIWLLPVGGLILCGVLLGVVLAAYKFFGSSSTPTAVSSNSASNTGTNSSQSTALPSVSPTATPNIAVPTVAETTPSPSKTAEVKSQTTTPKETPKTQPKEVVQQPQATPKQSSSGSKPESTPPPAKPKSTPKLCEVLKNC